MLIYSGLKGSERLHALPRVTRLEDVGLRFKLSAFLFVRCSFHSTKTGASWKFPPWAVTGPKEMSLWFHPNCPNPSTHFQGHWAPCMLAGVTKWPVFGGQQRSPSATGALLGHRLLPPQSLDSSKSLQVATNPLGLQLQCPLQHSIPNGDSALGLAPGASVAPAFPRACLPLNAEWAQAVKPPTPLALGPVSWFEQPAACRKCKASELRGLEGTLFCHFFQASVSSSVK